MEYPHPPHLTWSPNRKSDKEDRILETEDCFIGKEVVYLEKLDGENTVMSLDRVHARSVDSPSTKWRTLVSTMYGMIKHAIPRSMYIYGENMYATHSIEYGGLPSAFFVFAVLYDKEWFSWGDTVEVAKHFGFDTVPTIYKNSKKLEKHPIPIESEFGGACEGYVVRNKEAFSNKFFSDNIAKCVRHDHVQTDEIWYKSWTKANFTDDPIERVCRIQSEE